MMQKLNIVFSTWLWGRGGEGKWGKGKWGKGGGGEEEDLKVKHQDLAAPYILPEAIQLL